jgi:hypothetical protein
MDYKCILSLRVARQLLAQGFRLIDVEPSRKLPGRLVFIFANTPELNDALAQLN